MVVVRRDEKAHGANETSNTSPPTGEYNSTVGKLFLLLIICDAAFAVTSEEPISNEAVDAKIVSR